MDKTKEDIALDRYNKGEQFSVSTFIDEDTIIMGYGNLDYDFEFPLPNYVVVKEFGTHSWSQYFKIKGVNKYVATNLKTNEQQITPYFTREELIEHQKLNPNFSFKPI